MSSRLEENDNSRKEIQEKLHEACEALRRKIDEMEERINRTLEDEFKPEDERLQRAFNEISSLDTENKSDFQLLLEKAQAELLVKKIYVLEKIKSINKDLLQLYNLRTKKRNSTRVDLLEETRNSGFQEVQFGQSLYRIKVS